MGCTDMVSINHLITYSFNYVCSVRQKEPNVTVLPTRATCFQPLWLYLYVGSSGGNLNNVCKRSRQE